MNIIAMSQDNIWKNPISCNVTNKKNDHIYIYIYIYIYRVIDLTVAVALPNLEDPHGPSRNA